MFRQPRSLSVLEDKAKVLHTAMTTPGRLENINTKDQIEKLRVIHERLARINDSLVDVAGRISQQITKFEEKKTQTNFAPKTVKPPVEKIIPPETPRQMVKIA